MSLNCVLWRPVRLKKVSLPAQRWAQLGTRATESWRARFRASVVVYGHLHIRRTHRRGGVRFEEVSLGYPRQWKAERGIESHLREILPG